MVGKATARFLGGHHGKLSGRVVMVNAVRQLEEHEKKLATARISYNSSYSAPSKVQTTPPTKPASPNVVN